MRQLAIAVLAIALATATVAQAGDAFGSRKAPAKDPFASPFDSSALRPPPGFGAPATPAYKPHAAPSSLNPPGNTDGGKPFKPFKGTSTYEGPGAFKPYKPPKMKSVYDQ